MNGGYITIDFGSLDLAVTTKQTIAGLSAKLANAIKSEKPIYALIGGTSPISVYTRAGSVTGTTDIIFGTTIITVDTEDGATVASAISTTAKTTTKKG